jgi:hypothetical protein
MNIENLRAEEMAKLVAKKAANEEIAAKFGSESMRGRRAVAELEKFESRVADLNRNLSAEAVQAFINASSNEEANVIAKAFRDTDAGYFGGMRVKWLVSHRADFSWVTDELKPYNDLFNPNQTYQSDAGWRWFGD